MGAPSWVVMQTLMPTLSKWYMGVSVSVVRWPVLKSTIRVRQEELRCIKHEDLLAWNRLDSGRKYQPEILHSPYQIQVVPYISASFCIGASTADADCALGVVCGNAPKRFTSCCSRESHRMALRVMITTGKFLRLNIDACCCSAGCWASLRVMCDVCGNGDLRKLTYMGYTVQVSQ